MSGESESSPRAMEPAFLSVFELLPLSGKICDAFVAGNCKYGDVCKFAKWIASPGVTYSSTDQKRLIRYRRSQRTDI